MTKGCRHFDRRYFTIRQQVDEGDIMPVWIAGLENPADVGTKPIDGPTMEKHKHAWRGQTEIPIPTGSKIWFGPPHSAVLRGNF